ncbi:restriction endonuclease subunit M [Gardnerella swidsinskii]|uniref:restriction endonuclease subunit M n=3 Tax=Bifidobacteriaceae TaxID=31953 RepID=UPI00157336EC|nr:restriction endonuclease subunit M [Gardnerella vaginalis]
MSKSILDYTFEQNVDEQTFYEKYPKVFSTLLLDHTTKRNICWATNDYKNYGHIHQAHSEITIASITGKYAGLIAPRTSKSRELQISRTKNKAEVFTPSWICNEQNNLVDEVWFGRSNVFNRTNDKSWISTTEKIEFSDNHSKNWMAYVDERRMEITCGEAPYLVSRYDATTGEIIPLKQRIGLLDRKLRVVKENTSNEIDWLKWSKRAFESIYGFEYQGDSLLLARENLLATYVDYMRDSLNRKPTESELLSIATIISWNIWQMDGLTGCPPYCSEIPASVQPTLFDFEESEKNIDSQTSTSCQIKDWRTNKTNTFNDLLLQEKNDGTSRQS